MFKKLKKFHDNFNNNSTELYIKISSKIHNLNESAQTNLNMGAIISMVIGLIIIASVIPSAIGMFYSYETTTIINNTTTGWVINGVEDVKVTTLWWLLPFIAIATVLYMIYKRMD